MLLPIVFISGFLEAIESINCLSASIDQFCLLLKSSFVWKPTIHLGFSLSPLVLWWRCWPQGGRVRWCSWGAPHFRRHILGNRLLVTIAIHHDTARQDQSSQATNMILRRWKSEMIKLRRQPPSVTRWSRVFATKILSPPSPKRKIFDWKRRRHGRVGGGKVLKVVIGKVKLLVTKSFWFCWSSHDD